MRLLQFQDDGKLSLVSFTGNNIPPYAILSHTWGPEGTEVTFKDLKEGTSKSGAGYDKLIFLGEQAARDNLKYFWSDTCCIDKSSSQELQESINSMFRWYQNAKECYAYLSDVSTAKRKADYETFCFTWESAFRSSKWFKRGWTLQELLAPRTVKFFSREGQLLGDKKTLERQIHEITGIAISVLQGTPLHEFSVEERFSWAKGRQTTREEDKVYSLLGIFGVHMYLNYSEGEENAFKRLRKEIRESLDGKALPLTEEQKKTLLESLRFDQIDARQMSIKSAHIKTCKWLLHKPEYIDWLDPNKLREHHGFLWIKGKPGTGKSTLMKFALSHARKTMKNRTVISFFFNARGEDMEKSTVGTYRSLILQLLERLPALQRVLDSLNIPMFSTSTDHQWNMESLEMLLEDAIHNLEDSSVVCYIDALDECDEQQIRDMVRFFERIGELAVLNSIQFRVCFSSRHYPHVTIRKGLNLVLEGQEGHSQDINNYLESELKIGKSKLAQQVRTELQEKASGIFMWVVLVVDILNKEHDRGQMYALRRRLREIPGDLHELFRDILTRDSRDKDKLTLCIQWVLFAKQPLNPEQLYFAILSEVEPDALSAWDSDEITRNDMKRFILDSSKGLAEITTSRLQRVQFIHESVRDFLLKGDGLSKIWPDLGSNFSGQSHERLKRCCLTQMDVDVHTSLTNIEIPENTPEGSSQKIPDLRKFAADLFPFLEYAVQNVLYHADAAEGSGVTQKNFIANFPLMDWIKLDNLLEKHQVRKHTLGASLLYILAERNMSNLIRIHPTADLCFEVEKERYGAPLFAAAATGSNDAIRVFIEVLSRGHSTEGCSHEIYMRYCEDKGRRKALGPDFKNATKRGMESYLKNDQNEALLALIIRMGKLSVVLKYEDENNLLLWAAHKGLKVVVQSLLDTVKVDVDSKDSDGRTPLFWAASNRKIEIVKLLLDTGKVDVDSKNSDGRTPLFQAASNGNVEVVKLLLDTGKVDVDSKNSYGRTPLSQAASNGDVEVVKLLLATSKVDVDSKDSNGRTPLSWAAQYGSVEVAKLLLDTSKVDVDSKDSYGRTPLSQAASNGKVEVIKLLLDTGKVDVDSKDSYGRTPLFWAAGNGEVEIVKLLLDTGKVDVDSENSYGWTPLSWAAQSGSVEVAKLLLDTGKVDVDSKDSAGRTPLSQAAQYGSVEVAKLLLATGKVDVNSKDSDGRTPLSRAAQYGKGEVAKLLLDTSKVDVDSKDSNGRTPLSQAAQYGNVEVAKLLLDTGKVDVDSKDSAGRTPLSRAAGNGKVEIAKLLLDIGKVDINAKDLSGKTPLSWAKQHLYYIPNQELAKLLESHGAHE